MASKEAGFDALPDRVQNVPTASVRHAVADCRRHAPGRFIHCRWTSAIHPEQGDLARVRVTAGIVRDEGREGWLASPREKFDLT